ncbi:MAG: hypothetical protein ABL908_16630 [Hyphomicrobium sp.]
MRLEHLTEAQKRAYILADNRLAEKAGWDSDILAIELQHLAETAIMAHEVFGVGDHHPARPARDMTMDEFERYSRWCEDYQRRLHDDPAAEFGPPGGETWPREPAA